jgi:hypothetical protein
MCISALRNRDAYPKNDSKAVFQVVSGVLFALKSDDILIVRLAAAESFAPTFSTKMRR